MYRSARTVLLAPYRAGTLSQSAINVPPAPFLTKTKQSVSVGTDMCPRRHAATSTLCIDLCNALDHAIRFFSFVHSFAG